VGSTTSANFPVRNAFRPTIAGGSDAFVARLNAQGSALLFSSFLGGSLSDIGAGIDIDGSGNVYVVTSTLSTNFPVVAPLQATLRGMFDVAITKINPSGSAILYSTYLGGSNNDFPGGIAVDSEGNSYVTGLTLSTDFPTLNAFQKAISGSADAFITKLNPSGSALVYSSYIGGSGDESARGIAIDREGRSYITGFTDSTNFPLKNPTQPAYGGGSEDCFVAIFSPNGSELEFSTYIGGSGPDFGNGIAVNANRRVFVIGASASADFPRRAAKNLGGQRPDGDGPVDRWQVGAPEKALIVEIDVNEGPPCPPEQWVTACVTIVRGDIEINGAQWRKKGSSTATKIKRHPKGPEVKIFELPQDAIDFAGLDSCTDADLSFRSDDIVQLDACTLTQNVVFPSKHHYLEYALQRISMLGVGKSSTKLVGSILVNSGADEGRPNKIGSLTISQPSTAPDVALVTIFTPTKIDQVAAVGNGSTDGFNYTDYLELNACELTNFKDAVKTESSFFLKATDVTIKGAKTGFKSKGRVDISIAFFKEGFLDSVGLNLTSSTGSKVTNSEFQKAPIKIDDLKNSRFERVSADRFEGVNCKSLTITGRDVFGERSHFTSSTGSGIRLEMCQDVVIENSETLFNTGAGMAFFTCQRVTISNCQMSFNQLEGAGFSKCSGVVLKGNTIKFNKRAGTLRALGADVTMIGNVISDNGAFGVINRAILLELPKNGVERVPTTHGGIDVLAQDNIVFNNAGGGVQLEGDDIIDFGGGPGLSKGGNILALNANFDLINQTSAKISAKNNLWSSSDPAEILQKYVSAGPGVDVAPTMPLRTIYFAQFAEAPGFTSTMTATNPSRSNSAATLLGFKNSAGTGVNIKLNGSASPGGLQPGAVAPLGARSFSTDPATTSVNVGSMVAISGRPLAGTVLFSSPAGVDGVGRSELLTQFIAPVERSATRSVNTGIAVINPSTIDAVTVAIRLRDSATGSVKESTVTLGPGGQAAKFLDELFSGVAAEFAGTLSASAPTQIGATVIRTSPGQFATLPVTGSGSTRLLFAQFGEVGGVSSTLTFVNPSLDRTANVTAKIFDDNGTPLAVVLNGSERAGQFSFSIPPQSSVSFASPGTSATARIGSVVVDSSENIGGTILFGGSFGLAGVGASQALANFIAPAEQSSSGGVITGLALMNAGTTQVTVKLTIRDEVGAPLSGGTVDVVLKPQGHVAKFISQFFPNLDLANFRGTITGEATTGGQIGATVIRQSAAPLEFATLPVAEILP
jgi:hypothetical protein